MITMVLHGGGGKALITAVWWGLCSVWPLQADWLYCATAQLMSAYLTNNQRLDLDLIGQCVVPVATVQAALATHPGVYVQGVAAAPKASGGGTSSGGSSTGGGAKP